MVIGVHKAIVALSEPNYGVSLIEHPLIKFLSTI